MGNTPQGKKLYIVELLLAFNRLTQVIASPLANLIDVRSFRGPYGNSRYTWCGTVGRHFYRQNRGRIHWLDHPIAAFIQRITEKGWLFWWRDKHHTLEAYCHESEADPLPE